MNEKPVYLINDATCPGCERLSETFAEYKWAYAINNNYGEIVEFAFLPWLPQPPRVSPILFDDCTPVVWLPPEKIARYFGICDHQGDVWELLYRHVHPDWDEITSINGHPKANYHTANELMKAFISFDSIYTGYITFGVLPAMKGGFWMNAGFSQASYKLHLPDYVIMQVPHDQIKYKE